MNSPGLGSFWTLPGEISVSGLSAVYIWSYAFLLLVVSVLNSIYSPLAMPFIVKDEMLGVINFEECGHKAHRKIHIFGDNSGPKA